MVSPATSAKGLVQGGLTPMATINYAHVDEPAKVLLLGIEGTLNRAFVTRLSGYSARYGRTILPRAQFAASVPSFTEGPSADLVASIEAR